jgi:3-phosphoshikimate 1-carboxyvinyltransferase
MKIKLYKPEKRLKGRIQLSGSKSISNRALLIHALCQEDFPIHHLADALDTRLLKSLIGQTDAIYDAGAAGTTFRFLTAYLATQEGTQVLTGTDRMKQRPIKVLVDALRQLGAEIEYLEKEGYPPLKILQPSQLGTRNQLSIPASTSSQYISALLMIAPTLPGGLTLHLEGKIVSRPYIEMTLKLMQHFGVGHQWEANQIRVAPQAYQAQPFTVEADWSAASYYYGMGVLAEEVDLQLDGLFRESTQGDAVLSDMMKAFGIRTSFNTKGVHLSKKRGASSPEKFEWDFLRCPDLAQTLAVACAAAGTTGIFTGLETLRIKETDRIAALENELKKVGTTVNELPDSAGYFQISGKATVGGHAPVFDTYEDHRMAMAFAPLGMLNPVMINEPDVVVKSYPDFWKDLESLGFELHKA